MTDQVDLLESNRAEPPTEPHDEIGRAYSAPQPRQVEHVDRTSLRQRLGHRRPPAPRPRKTVHEHGRRTFAEDAIVEMDPVDRDLPRLHVISVAADIRHRFPRYRRRCGSATRVTARAPRGR